MFNFVSFTSSNHITTKRYYFNNNSETSFPRNSRLGSLLPRNIGISQAQDHANNTGVYYLSLLDETPENTTITESGASNGMNKL